MYTRVSGFIRYQIGLECGSSSLTANQLWWATGRIDTGGSTKCSLWGVVELSKYCCKHRSERVGSSRRSSLNREKVRSLSYWWIEMMSSMLLFWWSLCCQHISRWKAARREIIGEAFDSETANPRLRKLLGRWLRVLLRDFRTSVVPHKHNWVETSRRILAAFENTSFSRKNQVTEWYWNW